MAEKQIVLKNVRLSHPKLFEAEDYNGDGNFNYGAQFIVEPGSAVDKLIRGAIDEIAKAEWKDKAAQRLKMYSGDKTKYPYRDGDLLGKEETEGKWILASKRKKAAGRPIVNNRQAHPVMEGDEGAPYPGCFVNAIVTLYTQNNEYAGVRCRLEGVMFWADGDAFTGAKPADPSMFADLAVAEDEEALV